MKTLRLAAKTSDGAPAATQLILLPGAYQRNADFLAADFAAIAATSARPFDLLLPELDLTQLSSGDALPLLRQQLILPARAAGVKTLWLGGISLGGFNALCYAAAYPAAIDGLCLLAPWPGSRITRRLIDDAGGLEHWAPSPQELAGDAELRVWHWLREQQRAASRLPVFIGWGRDDRFAKGIAAYAEQLPEAQVETNAGGHDWPVWTRLWQRFCENDRFAA